MQTPAIEMSHTNEEKQPTNHRNLLVSGGADGDDDNFVDEVDETTSGLEIPLCKLSRNRKLVLLQPGLFWRKALLVFVASYALLPLMAYKTKIPGVLYVSLLVGIHVLVLFLYCYKVTFTELDVDRLSLGSRILGLLVVSWLLSVVSGWQDREHFGILAAQMLVLCLVHTSVLALLMVAVKETTDS